MARVSPGRCPTRDTSRPWADGPGTTRGHLVPQQARTGLPGLPGGPGDPGGNGGPGRNGPAGHPGTPWGRVEGQGFKTQNSRPRENPWGGLRGKGSEERFSRCHFSSSQSAPHGWCLCRSAGCGLLGLLLGRTIAVQHPNATHEPRNEASCATGLTTGRFRRIGVQEPVDCPVCRSRADCADNSRCYVRTVVR